MVKIGGIPLQVAYILRLLQSKGYEAYIVGGAIRNSLLNIPVKDWDITTSATPEQVKEIFPHTIDTGIKHGTVTVVVGKNTYEVTTFRVDGEYTDNRHPESVTFTTSLKDDLSRRDFTINAMAYSPETGLIDPFDGQADLKNKIIKCVGNPVERFNEDALRIMRAIRFAAQLDFDIEADTLFAVSNLSANLNNISAERIREELNKILIINNANKYLFWLYGLGLMNVILPELNTCFSVYQDNPYHDLSVGMHIIYSVNYAPSDLIIRLALLFHDIGKPLTKTFDTGRVAHFYRHAEVSADLARERLQKLRYDNDTIDTVCRLIFYHDATINPESKNIRKWLSKLGEEELKYLIQIKYADAQAHAKEVVDKLVEQVANIEQALNAELQKHNCVNFKGLAINGFDIMNMDLGIKQGKLLGILLCDCLDLVIEQPEKNNKEDLLNYIKQRMNGENKHE